MSKIVNISIGILTTFLISAMLASCGGQIIQNEPESDDYDDDLDEFEEDDDLQAITNLDQILDREGIDLSAEDPTINILTMYGAGLSIIEISKVLKMGVGEVKYIIDSNTKNQ